MPDDKMLNDENMATIEENYARVLASVENACSRAGRRTKDVHLVAVSKNVTTDSIIRVFNKGQRMFGENRAQEIRDKMPLLPKDIEWHFIGRLQRNKVKYIIDGVAMIHSVDSIPLAYEINRLAVLKNIRMPALIQVNLGGEDTKAGFETSDLRQCLEEIAKLPGIFIKGLMTIGPYYENPEDSRSLFRAMRVLRDEAASWDIQGADIRLLSMGMSHDYTIAIEEGADFIRVGSAIFIGR